jgi:hypothetical protein
MFGNSRKKNFLSAKKGNQNLSRSYDTKNDDDKLIVRDLRFNKEKKKIIKDNISNKINIKKIAIIVFLFLTVITILFSLRFIRFNVVEMLWKTNVTRGSINVNNKSVRYRSFKNGLMRISNDGVTYIDDVGNVKYTVSYNMKDPISENNNNYFAIADRNGYEFYIFDEKGVTGSNFLTNPIQKISLSDDGIIYILQSDEESSYINLFRSKGEEVDISIKANLTNDGMPIDISTSNDGTELVVSYMCLSNNDIYSKATYYNFSDAGKAANSKRIVGEFINEFSDMFLARVHFFDNKNSCLIYDKGIYFVSTANQSKPNIVVNQQFNNKIKSIFYNNEYIVFIFENNQMYIYNKSGTLLADKNIDFDYENFYISDNYIIFLYGSRVMIYDTRGRMIFDKVMDMEVQYVAKKKSLFWTELLVGLIDGVECIRFY